MSDIQTNKQIADNTTQPDHYDKNMTSRDDNLPATVILTNPDDDCSPESLQRFFETFFNDDEKPIIDSLHAAEILREIRPDSIR